MCSLTPLDQGVLEITKPQTRAKSRYIWGLPNFEGFTPLKAREPHNNLSMMKYRNA